MDHQQQPAALSWASIPLGLPGAVCQGCTPGAYPITHAQTSHSGEYPCVQHTERDRQLPTHFCKTEAAVESGSRAWGKQQAWHTGSSRLFAGAFGSMGNESPEASCVLSPTPPVPKHWWHLDQNQKKETMPVLSAVPALTSPDSSVGVLTEEPR